MTTVSGRQPCTSASWPRVLPWVDSTSTQSPSARPRRRAAPAFMITQPWPRMLCATSSISGMPTLLPELYCMLLVVMPQKG